MVNSQNTFNEVCFNSNNINTRTWQRQNQDLSKMNNFMNMNIINAKLHRTIYQVRGSPIITLVKLTPQPHFLDIAQDLNLAHSQQTALCFIHRVSCAFCSVICLKGT